MRGHVRKHRRAVRAAQHVIDNFTIGLEAHRRQFGHAVVERNAVRAELQDVRAERDDVIRLAKTREAAWIKTVFQAARQAMEFDCREQELIR